MDSNIQIVLATDRNYLDFVWIILTSLLCHHTTGHLSFHLLHCDLNKDDFRPVEQLRKFGDFTFHPLCLNTDEFKRNWGVQKTTFFRLEIPNLMPNLGKIIYLDCDMIVLDDIEKLWNIDLGGAMLGAVGDRVGLKCKDALSVPVEKYVNAGVLLLDLGKMREENAIEIMRRIIREEIQRFKYLDQDVINYCFWRQTKLLDQRWNIITSTYRNPPVSGMYTDEEVRNALANPGIVHFTGSHKPWFFWKTGHHPYAEAFWYYTQLAPVVPMLKWKIFLKRLLMGWCWKDSDKLRAWDKSILNHTWNK